MRVSAWTDQKSASSNPDVGSPRSLAFLKNISARSYWSARSLWYMAASLDPIGAVPSTIPMAKVR